MNSKKKEIFLRYAPIIALFITGILILAARNPDPILNPIVYAEDGTWTGQGLSNGWVYAIFNARHDYFVFLNIALLFFSTKISLLATGSPIEILPESIAITSLAFFSAVATAVFAATNKIAPIVFRLALYLLLLLIPLGTTQNEIIGRILQVGFYIPIISVLLLHFRENFPSKSQKYAIDFSLLLCAATNPVIFPLVALYLFRDFLKDYNFRACVKRNQTLVIPFFLLLAVLLPRMGGDGGIPGKFVISNFIEAIIARPIAYPFVFPWYGQLSDGLSLVFFSIWLCLILFSYSISKNPTARFLMLLLVATVVVYDLATILMRPGLTGFLSNYQKTFPDRYFMGLNALTIFLTIFALAQISITKNIGYKVFSYFTLAIIIAIYASHPLDIFEKHASKLPLKGQFTFSEQVCLSEEIIDSSISLIQIYPNLPNWKMAVPNKLIDKSNCKYTILDDADLLETQHLYKTYATPQLNARSPIKILMTMSNRDNKVGVKRIGIRFGTNATKNSGEADLHLTGSDGSAFVQRFSLSDLADNEYRYFSLDSRHYISGKIVSVSGGGIATWESRDDKANANTCIIYEYNNGKRRPTPGCPPF